MQNLDEPRDLSLDEARCFLDGYFSDASIDKILDIRNAYQALNDFFKKHDSRVPNNLEMELSKHFKDFFESKHLYCVLSFSHESFSKTKISDMRHVMDCMDLNRNKLSPDDLELFGLLCDAIFEELRNLVYQDKIKIKSHIEGGFFKMKPLVWFEFVMAKD